MSERKQNRAAAPKVPEFESGDLTQDIDSALEDLKNRRDEPTLSQTDFDSIEFLLR